MNKIITGISNFSESVKAGIIFLICSFLQKGISTITTPIFTRLLSPEEYGKYSVFTSWSSIITIFITLKMASSVMPQTIIKKPNEKKEIISSIHGVSLVLFVLYILSFFIFRNLWVKFTKLEPLLILMLMLGVWSTNVFEIWAQSERIDYKYKALVFVSLLLSVLKPVFGILAIKLYPLQKAEARIISLVLVELGIGLVLFFIQTRDGKIISIKKWKYYLSFTIPLIPHYLSLQILNQTDRLMINSICGERETGLYSLAYQIAMVLTLFNTSLINTLNPWILRKIKKQEYTEIQKIFFIFLRIVCCMGLLFIWIAPEVLYFFAPSSYFEARYVIPPITMSTFLIFIYCIFMNFEFYYEKRKYTVYASVGGAILNLLLNYLLIPIYGYNVAAYTTLICYVLFCVFHAVSIERIKKINKLTIKIFDYNKIIIELSIYLCIGFLGMFLYKYIYIRFLLIAIIIVILFLCKKLIKETFKNILHKYYTR